MSSHGKRVSNITPLAVSVRKTATEKPIPRDEIAPPRVSEWLNVYARANNTSREILFGSTFLIVACLVGATNIKMDCKLRHEYVNLFMLCLSPPGSGKSPGFQNSCSQPVGLHVEDHASTTLFVDEFTEAGLFRQLQSSLGTRPLLEKRKYLSSWSRFLE